MRTPRPGAYRSRCRPPLLRTADLLRLRFRENLNTPDVEFFIRLAQEGAQFVFVPEYLMEYRVHLGAVTASGLWTEELVECLTPIEVKPEIESYKRQFLIPMVVNAVSRCLQQGNMERARALLQNRYYPRRPSCMGGRERISPFVYLDRRWTRRTRKDRCCAMLSADFYRAFARICLRRSDLRSIERSVVSARAKFFGESIVIRRWRCEDID